MDGSFTAIAVTKLGFVRLTVVEQLDSTSLCEWPASLKHSLSVVLQLPTRVQELPLKRVLFGLL